MAQHYDGVIMGGGLTGTALFVALADDFIKHNKSLVLCERSTAPIDDNRMLALGYAGSRLLAEFGIWDDILPHAYPIDEIEITYKHKNTFIVHASEIGLPVIGWTIPHKKLQDILWQRIEDITKKHSNMKVNIPFEMTDLDLSYEYARIDQTTEKKEQLQSGIIFVAAGTSSLAAQQVKINYRQFNGVDSKHNIKYSDDSLQSPSFAVAAVGLTDYSPNRGYWFGGNMGSNQSAKQQEHSGGVTLALTPHIKGDGRFVAIASLPAGTANKPDAHLYKAWYKELLNEITGGLINEVYEQPVVFPARTYLADERVKGPVVLLGNAAHSVAPLGGQNFNLTLWTIAKLKSSLHSHLAAGKEITNHTFLGDFITQTEPLLNNHIQLIHQADKLLSSASDSESVGINNILKHQLPDNINTLIVSAFMGIIDKSPLIRNKIFASAAGVSRLGISPL